MKDLLFEKLIRQLVPEDILTSFEIEDLIDKKSDELVICLVEKETEQPAHQKELVLNGYMKDIELTHFPSNGRKCFLRLRRRRWKIKDENPPKTYYYNTYDFAVPGTKATKSFGSFLKEFN